MTQRTLKVRSTLMIACLGLAASMAACLGDDSTDAPTRDAGADHAVTADSTTPPDNASPRPDSAPDTSATPDAGRDVSVGDGGTAGDARDSAPEATTADARDSAPEAARETGPDGNPPVEAGDARVDQVAEGAAPEASIDAGDAADTALHMCGVMDSIWGLSPDAAASCENETTSACPGRAEAWGTEVMYAFFGGEMYTDCRLRDMFMAAGADPDQFFTDQSVWNLEFFGCPNPELSPGPIKYGLVVTGLENQLLTTADLNLLSFYYVQAVMAAADAYGASLSPAQVNAINAQLNALAARRPNTVNLPTYTFDSCPLDAGTD